MTATPRAIELAKAAALAADDKRARDVVALDVSDQLALTDVFLLASAPNDRQVRAIVDEIEDALRPLGAKPVRREGEKDGRWVLIDFVDIVVHVQHTQEREFYGLERLWKDCPEIDLELPDPAGREGEDDAYADAPARVTGWPGLRD
ncbi:ribosome silencing factor [Arsenicicoccus dermatophilus]|uniref:ribosome silencing factor n=1 Tax=Arsenicicoccus dermatophilus TaxID=1076331 RepID=UPI0039175EFA